jgi:alkylation response protein AidB-like acyl-CoA dehydrogenase
MDTDEGFEPHREWERTLAQARLSTVTWPREFGGRDAPLLQWVVFEDEYYVAGAPSRVSANGIALLGSTLMAFGTEEQKQRVLPRMSRADDIWAQAWSEPEAGSDLAGVRSKAVRVKGDGEAGGGWVLNGQKTWSSRASHADRAFGLFRSDPDAQRHRGLTYFMFDLRAEGVTVRPIGQLDGVPGFAEIFLDDVFVPDEDVIGAPGDGWRVAMSTASNERGLTLRSPGRFVAAANRLVDLWASNPDPKIADRVVDSWIGAQAYRLYTLGTVSRLNEGGKLGAESSVNKLFWSELDVELHETALDLLGADGELAGAWQSGYLFSLAGPIYAGTNEIQRNVVAERLLGLPRGDR